MGEKAKYGSLPQFKADAGFISLGLSDQGSGAKFTHWNASIIPQQGQHIGQRIYEIKIVAGPDYPKIGPQIKFKQRVDLSYVRGDGSVDLRSIPNFYWNSNSSIFAALVALRKGFAVGNNAQRCAKVSGNY